MEAAHLPKSPDPRLPRLPPSRLPLLPATKVNAEPPLRRFPPEDQLTTGGKLTTLGPFRPREVSSASPQEDFLDMGWPSHLPDLCRWHHLRAMGV